jgi:hypothetical protein
MPATAHAPQHIAIVGAGMAGVTCARTLAQAGFRVTVFEKSSGLGGRMATRDSAFGSFDHGAQYFTARDPRFVMALETSPQVVKRWSANVVQRIDEHGHVTQPATPSGQPHWVPVPGMTSLVGQWAQALAEQGSIERNTRVVRIEPDSVRHSGWQLRTESPDGGQHVFSGFDKVLLAQPASQGRELLQNSELFGDWAQALATVQMAPCWTLMLAFPQAVQPGLTTLGPQWNAARSSHHRIAWLARESSKPQRSQIERWTVQASAEWSTQHLHDDAPRVQAKLCKAFAEVTGIYAEPAHVDSQRWLYAKTTQALGAPHLLNAALGLGLCGDWCTGYRVEDAYLSGLSLALAVAQHSKH